MCGIYGLTLNFVNHLNNDINKIIDTFSQNLSHRGPDDNGFLKYKNLLLGHTRLSIVELSENGSQPMISESGNYILIFNGEIYNHHILRNELNKNFKINWKGMSDTETLLCMIEYFGISKSLNMIDGMFAFAIYNVKESILYLARDIYGEKPLYYAFLDDNLIFASEVQPIVKCFPNLNKISRSNFHENFDISFLLGDKTIYSDVKSLLPGTYLSYIVNQNNSDDCI